jgi:hypothetical protein
MLAKHCVIPLAAEGLLAEYVQAFEAQNSELTAIVRGVYVPNVHKTEAEQSMRMLGRVKQSIQFFSQILDLHAFLLLADAEHLTPEILTIMAQHNVQIMSNEEYHIFYASLL